MNILVVQDSNWFTKVAYACHHVLELLQLRGHKVIVLDYEDDWRRSNFFDWGSLKTREFKNVSRLYDGASITVKRLGFIKLPILCRLTESITATIEMLKVIKKCNIDLMLIYYPNNALQAIFLAKLFKLPTVYYAMDIEHEFVPQWYLRKLAFGWERLIYKGIDHIIALTYGLKNYLIQMGASPDKVTVIPQGVNVDYFKVNKATILSQYGIGRQDKIILFIGTLFDFCGIDEILARLKLILAKVPNAKLVVVGDGHAYDSLVNQSHTLGLGKNVIFTGRQSFTSLPDFISAANVCICPFQLNKITRDISPLKLYEYMAGGKPVVMTNLPGTRSMLGSDNGVLYGNNYEGQVSLIISLLENEELAKEQGEKARRFVEENCSWDRIVPQFEGVLEESIKEKQNEGVPK